MSDVLPALKLAEELSIEELDGALTAWTEMEPHFDSERLERNFYLGGLSLDLALHPETDMTSAQDYFEDAEIYWQMVLSDEFIKPKSYAVRTHTQLLLAHLPAFKLRKEGSDVPDRVWDEIDTRSVITLEDLLTNPNTRDEDKAYQAARIGTQLLCGVADVQVYPSTGRELMKASNTPTPDHLKPAHPFYAIEDGRKMPIWAQMKSKMFFPRKTHVNVSFGDLAQKSLRVVAPDLIEHNPEPGCSSLVLNWLTNMTRGVKVEPYQADVIDIMADRLIDRMDAFRKSKQ